MHFECKTSFSLSCSKGVEWLTSWQHWFLQS